MPYRCFFRRDVIFVLEFFMLKGIGLNKIRGKVGCNLKIDCVN